VVISTDKWNLYKLGLLSENIADSSFPPSLTLRSNCVHSAFKLHSRPFRQDIHDRPRKNPFSDEHPCKCPNWNAQTATLRATRSCIIKYIYYTATPKIEKDNPTKLVLNYCSTSSTFLFVYVLEKNIYREIERERASTYRTSSPCGSRFWSMHRIHLAFRCVSLSNNSYFWWSPEKRRGPASSC
jgi:hypothetical protein